MHTDAQPNQSLKPVPATHSMHAVTHRKYGEPELLAFEQVARPVPGDEGVLVRVHAAGVSVGDHHVVTGKPYLIRLSPYGGLPRPRNLVPGMALAGRVEAVGAKVSAFKVGDEVFGEARTGAFAEYAVLPAKLCVAKPSNLSFDEAAAVPWAVAALRGLRDAGGLKAGQHVLINGASGGVGTWAVQIARALGAEVTAVCSGRNAERMHRLDASEVIDYTKQDFAAGGPRFDLLLDLVGNRSLSDFRRALRPKGTYVSCGGGGGDWFGPLFWLAKVFVASLFCSHKLTSFFAEANQQDLLFLKELVEAGKARPVIERRYPLSEAAAALRHVGEGHTQGQTILVI